MATDAWPFGVGPDGFQDAYLRAKPARSPEDVTSAHAAFVDWIVLLGPLGIAWIALTLRLVVGWPRADEGPDERDEPMDGRTSVVIAAILALALVAAQSLAEESIADARWVLSRGGAAVLFGLAFVAALRVLGRGGARLEPWLLGAVVAVLAQSQIEMILFQPGLVVWLMVALGAIAGPPSRSSAEPLSGAGGPRPLDAVPIALPAAAAMAILAFGLVPQWQQDRLLDRAAAEVVPLAEVRDAWREGWSDEVLRGESGGPRTQAMLSLVREAGGVEIEAMLRSALASGTTPQERGEAVRRALQRFDGGQRAKAADVLRAADEVHPTNPVALESAVKQLAAAGRRTVGARRSDIVDPALHAAAIELAVLLDQREGTARSAAMLADLWLERARATSDAATLDAAERAVRTALERQPRGWGRWVDLGDVLAVRERFAEATEAYATALAIDDDLELDPLVRMTAGVRATTAARRDATRIAADGGERPPAGWPLR
jgi:tetratricopeptide (TPR) repeat protein